MKRTWLLPLMLVAVLVFGLAACDSAVTPDDDGLRGADAPVARVVAPDMSLPDCIPLSILGDDGPPHGGSGGPPNPPPAGRLAAFAPCAPTLPVQEETCDCFCSDENCFCYPCRLDLPTDTKSA